MAYSLFADIRIGSRKTYSFNFKLFFLIQNETKLLKQKLDRKEKTICNIITFYVF